ncbi:phospholipase D-like domain-containing protein [Halomarina oriensis]|uniref:Phospholipase D-like domain-containing protein n=1 Tax=Halomarina oriensis TaxID=671145 RepID=A0A6B0GS18_9EURY|nr:phospholipase D-like domain-containing protein [Halomarina oriensis]MWG36097.1 hypothetical protein [Halomarina oriensis]
MTDGDLSTTAERLHTQSPNRLWGVSPESVYTTLAARSVSESATHRLSPHIRAEMLRTNDERDSEDVVKIHDWILKEFNLLKDGRPTLLGMVVLVSTEPQSLVRAIALSRLRTAETVLRSCTEVEGLLKRREFDSLLTDADESILGPLLGSLGFVTIYPDSVELHHDQVESALVAQSKIPRDLAVAEAYKQILTQIAEIGNQHCLDSVVERMTGSAPTEKAEAIEVVATLANTHPVTIDSEELTDAIEKKREEYEHEYRRLRSLLTPKDKSTLTHVDAPEPVDSNSVDEGKEFFIDVLATVSAHPGFAALDVQFISDRLSITSYDVYQELSTITGVDCEVRDNGLIEFASVPTSVDGNDLREEYTTHLVERCSTVRHRIDALSNASVTLTPEAIASDQIVAEDYASLDDGDVAPAYFTYTLVDPDALGEAKMDTYVGNSRGLGRERAQLRRWHRTRPPGLRSYTAMTDRLFSLGLERDLEHKILRIMTPFDDNTFNEYVSQIRRLLEQGFEVRLLTRHTKEQWEWQRLQRNLLSEIKEHRDRITVRTYSRFKEQQRVKPDMDFRKLGEFGIHGKVQTIGQPGEGAALLGSANFMRNSYDWNPECGIYTERTQFVDAAIEFFDIVWDISESDELSMERLQAIPDRKLVPTYYS